MEAPSWMTSDTATSASATAVKSARFLEPTPEDLLAFQTMESLDLSNSDIVGEAVVSHLHFISLVPTLALRSIDLSHNRLRDAGTTALAALLKTHAAKLSRLESLDLFENGIRDHGALTLTKTVQELAMGPLGQLESVNLHDNDISEAVLSAIDDIWTKIHVERPPEWEREAAISSTDGTSAFGKLLVSQMGKIQDGIRREEERVAREKERVRQECIASTMARLKPLCAFLKHALWEYVTTQRKVLVNPMVLRVFPLPTEKVEQEIMRFKYGVDRNSKVSLSREYNNWQGSACRAWRLDAKGYSTDKQTTGEGSILMSDDERKIWTELIEKSIKGPMPRHHQSLLTASDEYGVFLSVATREKADASTVGVIVNQIASFHSLLEATRDDAAAKVKNDTDMSVLSEALSRDLGLDVRVSANNVHLSVIEFTQRENISSHIVEFQEFSLDAAYSSSYSDSRRRQFWRAPAFELELKMPSR